MPAAGDELRYHLELYGIDYDDWGIDFATFSDHTKILVEEYISDAVAYTSSSAASDTNKFIFPFHIKKKFFIEGTIKGQITLASSGATSHVTSYRVTVCSVNESTSAEEELYSTGWVTIDDDLSWDSTYSIGEEKVYVFWIDAWEYEELGEFDRIFLKVQCNADANAVLWHSNDPTYEDIYVDIPVRL